MLKSVTLSALALTLAAPAFAGPGADQLARSLGVEPGRYTLSQLVQLEAAREEGGAAGAATAAFILSSPGNNVVSSRSVEAGGGLTVNEATLVERALRDDTSLSAAQAIAGVTSDATTTDRGVVTPGKAQLAASLGLDPAAYTTAELVEIRTQRLFADNSK